MICTMKIMKPIIALIALMVTVGQEVKIGMITKDFVTIGMIMNIDAMFASLILGWCPRKFTSMDLNHR